MLPLCGPLREGRTDLRALDPPQWCSSDPLRRLHPATCEASFLSIEEEGLRAVHSCVHCTDCGKGGGPACKAALHRIECTDEADAPHASPPQRSAPPPPPPSPLPRVSSCDSLPGGLIDVRSLDPPAWCYDAPASLRNRAICEGYGVVAVDASSTTYRLCEYCPNCSPHGGPTCTLSSLALPCSLINDPLYPPPPPPPLPLPSLSPTTAQRSPPLSPSPGPPSPRQASAEFCASVGQLTNLGVLNAWCYNAPGSLLSAESCGSYYGIVAANASSTTYKLCEYCPNCSWRRGPTCRLTGVQHTCTEVPRSPSPAHRPPPPLPPPPPSPTPLPVPNPSPEATPFPPPRPPTPPPASCTEILLEKSDVRKLDPSAWCFSAPGSLLSAEACESYYTTVSEDATSQVIRLCEFCKDCSWEGGPMCKATGAEYTCYPAPAPPPRAPLCSAEARTFAVPLILDTDLSIDVDDVGAVCLAHALADRCEARILSMVHNTGLPNGAAGLSVLNEFYGRGYLPIGAYRGPVGNPELTKQPRWTNRGRGRYVDDIVAGWSRGNRTANGTEVPDAVDVLRASLADAKDGSVVYVSVGHLTNLEALVESAANFAGDGRPSGRELIRTKVKRLLLMGGRTFSTTAVEWNFGGCGGGCGPYDNLGNITYTALVGWPTSVPISFLGFEAGLNVGTGGFFIRDPPPFETPCGEAYRLFCSRLSGWCGGSGRSSWDPMTVLYGVRGNTGGRFRREVGTMIVNPISGANDWVPSENQSQPADNPASQENLILNVQRWGGEIGREIDALLREPPARAEDSTNDEIE